MTAVDAHNEALGPYVPRLAVAWLRETPDALWREVDGTLVFVDISGFTQLTERLARKGKVGAEELSDILNATFADLMEVAYRLGAGLVKWGGDAVLLLFDGAEHAARAVAAGYRMRARLRQIGRVSTGAGRVTLQMSLGIHSGTFHFFLVGDPEVHRELIVSGPAASRTAEMEALADAGEIAMSSATVALLDPAVVGEAKGDGWLLAAEAQVPPREPIARPPSDGLDLGLLLPPAIRGHLLSAAGAAEHRRIVVGFVQFSGTDDILATEGPDALAEALDECVRTVQDATSRHGVTFFESDINRDGGKIMLTAGAPLSADHDEERMLRAARHVVERVGRLPVRIGLNSGAVFAGDFGPRFRKTFSVKGDAINLAARVMGKAQPGQVLATQRVIDRAVSRFDVEALPPFMVKGKSEPVEAVSVGRLGERRAGDQDTPLLGREEEMAQLRAALADARSGHGRLVELVGEPGIGKSRLVRELLADVDVPVLATTGDEYETAAAYWPFRSLLRELLGMPAEAADEDVAQALHETAVANAPELLPWLPLVGAVLDIDIPSSPEVDALAEGFRKERLEDVTTRFLAAALSEPAVLVFDDTHLLDQSSTDLLERITRQLASRPWLVVVTRRDVEGGFRAGDDPSFVTLRPSPLSIDAAQSLLAMSLQDTGLVPSELEALARRANGNPLFLRGLAIAVRDGASLDALPETVEALITSLIDQLPPDERTVLRFASVLGLVFHEAELRAVLKGHRLPTSRAALRRLSYFLKQEGHGRYRFDHQLLRDTAYEGLPYRLRRQLHGRAGEGLEAASATPEDVAELLSLHFFHAGQPQKTWYYSRIAGERAAEKYAQAQAEEMFARAVVAAKDVPDAPANEVGLVYVALGEARLRLGRNVPALRAYQAARARLNADPVRAALILKEEATIHSRLGHLPVALRSVSRGLRLLDGSDDPASLTARSRLEGVYAVVREIQGRYRDALTWARSAVLHAEQSGDAAARADALEAVHGAMSMLGMEPDRPYGEEALALYEGLGDRVSQSRALNNLAVLAWIQGRGSEALEMFRRAQVVAAEAGDTVGAAETDYNIGDVLLRLGRAAEAEVLLRGLVPVLQALGAEGFLASARRALAMALVLEGDVEEGQSQLSQARGMFVELGEPAEVVETDGGIAMGLLASGDLQAASDLAADAASRAIALDAGYLLPWLLRIQGAAQSDLAKLEEAESTLLLALEVANSHSRVERGFILAELGTLARRMGNLDEALHRELESAAAFDELGFVGSRRYPRS